MKPKLYVAGKYMDQRVYDVMDDLMDRGFELTLNWKVIEAKKPFAQNKDYNQPASEAMIAGVAASDVFVMVGHEKQHGAMVEMGAALALGKPVYIVDAENTRDSIFFAHSAIRDVTYEELLKELENYGTAENG